MSSPDLSLEQTDDQPAECQKRWWWFDQRHKGDKCEAALAWETIRRTKSYRALWRKFKQDFLPLLEQAGELQGTHLLQRTREAVGQPYFDFIIQGFDPGRTWLDLEEWQRLRAQGYIVWTDCEIS